VPAYARYKFRQNGDRISILSTQSLWRFSFWGKESVVKPVWCIQDTRLELKSVGQHAMLWGLSQRLQCLGQRRMTLDLSISRTWMADNFDILFCRSSSSMRPAVIPSPSSSSSRLLKVANSGSIITTRSTSIGLHCSVDHAISLLRPVLGMRVDPGLQLHDHAWRCCPIHVDLRRW
jgi:hypothetical protein